MIDVALVYRDQMVRGVVGQRPAILTQCADLTLLNKLSQRLADDEFAHQLLRAKGYGKPGQTLAEIVRDLPRAESTP